MVKFPIFRSGPCGIGKRSKMLKEIVMIFNRNIVIEEKI